MKKTRMIYLFLAAILLLSMAACGQNEGSSAPVVSMTEETAEHSSLTAAPKEEASAVDAEASAAEEHEVIEEPAYEPTEEELAARAEMETVLNLANNPDQEWTYSTSGDAWILSVVTAVVNPELPDQQGVSVCVPGGYITGIDTDGDGAADVTDADGENAVKGSLVIDYEATITSTHGQEYTASTAPVVLTTGAAGYGSQYNSAASTGYAADGLIAVSCGNRGKSDYVADEEGNVLYYTGDAPSCLCDQKAAARYVKYNMLLGNLPGSVDHFISTGGSGGGAHATMFAATSNNPDYYDYQIEAGAVGVYKNSDGSYTSAVTINGETVPLSDGAWGCVAYSPITSLYEADAAQAFEYYMDTTYEFNTPFQAQLAEYLSLAYMDFVNSQGWSVEEVKVGFDLNEDGDTEDIVDLTIEYDPEKYPETNGYHGSYLDLYLAEFTESLQAYLDGLGYGTDWTWFDENRIALSNDAVTAMTAEEKAEAFVEGRYTKGTTGGDDHDGPGGGFGGFGGPDDDDGPDGDFPLFFFGDGIRDGGPDAGTTASAGGGTDSSYFATFEEMAAAYDTEIQAIYAGDAYGKNIVKLYDPLSYIGAEGTEDPTWTRLVMGAVEGDMPMMSSLNLELQWLSAGVDTVIEWQWDGGHVPSEIFGDSLALYVDMMYGKYEDGNEITKPAPEAQTENGTSTEMSGTDLSGWVSCEDGKAAFALADVLKYRNAGATKAVPGFDAMDYDREDCVFGNEAVDARHWNIFLSDIFQNPEYAQVLVPLFNQS